jgi:hypothetical protein
MGFDPEEKAIMKHLTTLFSITITAFALTVGMTAPAHALVERTWVSGVGSDSNPCTRTAPCQTFAGAMALTAAGGEINCLDPGSFGTLIINKSIIISCETGTAGVLVSGGDGIIVNLASTDTVYLRGLDFEGSGPVAFPGGPLPGQVGILFNGAGTLHVEKCLIRGFSEVGIYSFPNGPSSLFVTDTMVADNGTAAFGGNILLAPTGSAGATVSLQRVQMTNGNYGLDADGSAGSFLSVSLTDSLASGNVNSGIISETTSGRTIMMVDHTKSSNNGTFGLKADGANAEMMVGSSTISGNGTGVVIRNGANLFSYQDNRIDLNATNGTPLPALALH